MQTVVVVFRRWKDSRAVTALFPALLAAIHGDFCLGYEHIGQHAAADYHGVINQTIPAFPLEYAELAYELVRVGYRLTPRKRASCQQHERRRWLLRTG